MTILLLILAAVNPPAALSTTPAIYPAGHAEHAIVRLLVTIDALGDVSDVSVAASAGPDFDAAAQTAVHKWKFSPATRDGEAISSRVTIPFVFEPQAAASQPARHPVIVAHPSSTPIDEATADKEQEVSVRGAERKLSRGGSDFEIQVGQLAVIASQKASDILQLAPGIFIANEGGAGHADQVFLRGFDAEQGQAIEFTVNGVPINEVDNTDGHGYADTHFIIPELVKNLRVIEGPFDPHQGDFAEAGSADFELGVTNRRLELTGSYGSFGTSRALALWAPQEEREGTFAAVQAYNSQGYGTNRSSTNASAMAQYEGELGTRGLWRVLGTAYGTHYASAGVVRADDVSAHRVDYYGTEAAGQGGDSQRYSLSFDLQNPSRYGTLSQQVFATWRTLRIDENFTGYLLDPQTLGQTFHAQRGDMIEQDYAAFTAGARGGYKLTGEVFGLTQSLEVGYYARYDHTTPKIQRLRANTQIPYAIDEDLTTDIINAALFVDLDLHPTHWLTLRGGLRQEYFDYNVVNACATEGVFIPNTPPNQHCPAYDTAGPRLPSQRATATALAMEPKVTAIAQLAKPLSLSASFGQGTQSLDALYLFQDERAPFATVLAAEGGAIYQQRFAWANVSARAIGYYTHVDRDLVFNPLAGRLTQANGTTRAGSLGSVRLTGRFFDELASATYARATFDADKTLVPYIPTLIARSDTSFFGTLPKLRLMDHGFIGTVGFALNFIGERALPFSRTAAPTVELDASASLRWRWLRASVIVENLTNARYPLSEFFYASNFHSRAEPTLTPTEHFTAAPPLSALFTLSLLFDEESR